MSPDVISPQSAPVSRRARSPKGTSPRGLKADPATRKVSFYLSAESCRRLGVAASMDDTDKSKIVERLIREGLKSWVCYDRSRPDAPAMSESSAA